MTDITKKIWDKKTIELEGSILQSWVWGEFLQGLGKKVHHLQGGDFQALVVEAALPLKRKYLYCPRGPIGNQEQAVGALRDLAAADPLVVFCRIEPSAAPQNLMKADKDTQPTHNWVLNLMESEERLLMNMKPKHRYNLNLAQRKGVTVREGGKEDLLTAYRLLLETAGRNAFRLHPQDYYWQLFEHLYSKNLRLLLCEYKGEVIGVNFLTLFGDSAVYLHGGSSQRYKEVMAPYLLHWEAIRLCRGLGLKEYDFGGVAPEGQANHPWAGITRFKKGFGGRETVFPGSFDLVLSPVWYNVYKQARKFRSLLKQK
ncbi:MAG: lipid II:glycine glycyltransferase FemX [Candidatus Saccharibacteria bacterium]